MVVIFLCVFVFCVLCFVLLLMWGSSCKCRDNLGQMGNFSASANVRPPFETKQFSDFRNKRTMHDNIMKNQNRRHNIDLNRPLPIHGGRKSADSKQLSAMPLSYCAGWPQL